MAKRLVQWLQLPEWCKTTGNKTYLVIYKKLADKFDNSPDFVNLKIVRRRQLTLVQDNVSQSSPSKNERANEIIDEQNIFLEAE